MGRLVMVLALVATLGFTMVGCKREPAPPAEEPMRITPPPPTELPVPLTQPPEAPAVEEEPVVTEPPAAPAVEEPVVTQPPEEPIPK